MTDSLISFFATFFIWIMFLGLVVLWFIDGKIKKEQVLHACLSIILAWTFAEMIKEIYHTTRPFILEGKNPLVMFIPAANGSFPSSHTAAAFALALTIWLHDKKVGFFYLIAALLVGAARVLANVHYPVDILGGAVLGIIVAYMIEKAHIRTK
ncbi:MAG: phosphatase PAP2 family protein [Patescibacteria group bacterium]